MHWVWSVRHRLFVSVLFAMAVAVFLPRDYLPLTRTLCIWNAGAVNFLILTWMLMLQGTPQLMRHNAQQLDAGRLTILSSIVGAAFASFLAIFFLLRDTKGLSPNLLFLHLGLSVLTIVGSWMQVHTIFTMHYARGTMPVPRQLLAGGGFGFSGRRGTRLQRFFIFLLWDWHDLPSCRRADNFSFHQVSRAVSQRAIVLF